MDRVGFHPEVLHRFCTAPVLSTPCPLRHPRTDVHYFREMVPADLKSALGRIAAERTLDTKDPALAKVRPAEEKRTQVLIRDAMRARPEALPHTRVMDTEGEE